MRRFGSHVTVIERGRKLADREDPDIQGPGLLVAKWGRSAMKRVGIFANDNVDLAGATRRDFLVRAGASVGMLAAATSLAAATPAKAGRTKPHEHQAAEGASSGPFWPEGIRLVISISMQFEAGGQPSKGTDSPFPKVEFPPSVPSDAAANTWFAYGYREGIPRCSICGIAMESRSLPT
jgi:hypothetical protein